MTDPSKWQQLVRNNQTSYSQQYNIPQLQTSSITLRPLQPNPYPSLGYPIYPHSNSRNNQQSEEITTTSEQDKKQDSNRRTRISRACDACRRKKIKCDTSGPGNTCRSCKSSKLECTFNDSAKKRGPPKGYIEVLENRLKRMEEMLGTLVSNTNDDDTTIAKRRKLSVPMENNDGFNPSTIVAFSNAESSSQQSLSSGTMAEKKEKCPTVDSGPLAVELSSISTKMTTRYIGDMSPYPLLAQMINFEDARVASKIGIKIRRFGQSLVLYEKDDNSGKNGNQKLLESLGMLKPGETIKSLNDWIYKVAGIDKITSDSLMKIYFAYIHPGLPIINKKLFLKQYRGQIGEYPSAPLLNAIYGAAVRYIETCKLFGDQVPLDQHVEIKEGWSEKLFENLIFYVRGRYNPCISTIQAIVISQNHRASFDEKITSSWLLNSAAIRMAQDLGLHRSSESWDIPVSEKETRRRVWWSVYIMDKWSSAATGRPQTIFDEDCDEIYPNESADWEEVMDIALEENADVDEPRYPSLDNNVAQKAKSGKIPIYQPFVQLAKLSKILGKLLQGLYTPVAKKYSEKHGSDAIVTYLDNALSEWRSALPPALQISNINVRRLDSRGHIPLLSMSGLMYLSYCTLLILLHRPFIEKNGEKTRSSQSSLSICTSAATRCVDIAEKMHYRDFLLVSWNFAIYPVFTASLIHIYNAANPDDIISDVAKSNLFRACNVIKRLSKLSIGAAKLYDVLTQLTKIHDISMDNRLQHQSENDEDNRSKQQQKLLYTSYKHKPSTIHIRSSKSKSFEDNEVNSQHYVQQNVSSSDSHSPSTAISDPEIVISANSTPTSTGNGDWINGLYSCLQNENTNQQANSTSSNQCQQFSQNDLYPSIKQQSIQQQPLQNVSQESEPYTLRQFGLNINPVYTAPINHNQQMDIQTSYNTNTSFQQQQPFMLPINPINSLLFGLTDINFTESPINNICQQQTTATPSPYNAAATAATATTATTTTTTTTTTTNNNNNNNNNTSHDNSSNNFHLSSTNVGDQTMFRNRPDNPFWSVPSSIELDDWAAYLFPQQIPYFTNMANSIVSIQQETTTSIPAPKPSWTSNNQGWM
ncbi:fungal-specific transcription factor domain-containing protein [Cokeromyces recurvatus]|uniref:fungal-specific transcription factor domain-containing protein n=1 Tax=Cokeromyces recurvatus TaxID=90255 RepID=UPI00221F7326|nr:fungal-specific transcription factor domain-containing protein [Cokeromyces recurvatus]KAI7905436.1 fungal-specific transcription factor domain-containing protein [Cokeromyces recurvatus]